MINVEDVLRNTAEIYVKNARAAVRAVQGWARDGTGQSRDFLSRFR